MGFHCQILHGPTFMHYHFIRHECLDMRFKIYRVHITKFWFLMDAMKLFQWNTTWLHEYACSAVHSERDVGSDSARMTGLCIWLELCFIIWVTKQLSRQADNSMFFWKLSMMLLLIEDMVSITSFVKLCPTPADPISAVGFISLRKGNQCAAW